ncbi:hypothetical protein [Streptomyces sp. 11x1]|uniref:hypothetical protein n=1 Tax=Streptomyces sp. 11x1 TaxID=3038642 RepID=UPI00292F9670|nr:hypothetical protein [Streptomyces sp. 11x1]WNZ11701.1 hypothetical protein P8T65_31910 [Streptomyces sp. 11x1]
MRRDTTIGDDLRQWLKRKKRLARTTHQAYKEHIDLYLQPQPGHIKRRDLKLRHIEAMYDAIERENAERLIHQAKVAELEEARDAAYRAGVQASGKKEERRVTRRVYLDANAALREGRKGKRKITSAATMHRINATLSSFLGSGIKRGEYSTNWAALVELPAAKRAKPLVRTPERVEEWKRTGEKPGPVMVWAPEQTGAFLDFVSDDRLYALWHTFIFLGYGSPFSWVKTRFESTHAFSPDHCSRSCACFASPRRHPDWISRRFKRLVGIHDLDGAAVPAGRSRTGQAAPARG